MEYEGKKEKEKKNKLKKYETHNELLIAFSLCVDFYCNNKTHPLKPKPLTTEK